MKIAYVTYLDQNDLYSFSGTMYFIAKSLEESLGKFRIHGEALSQVQKEKMEIESKRVLKEVAVLNESVFGKVKKIAVEGVFKGYNFWNYFDLLKKAI